MRLRGLRGRRRGRRPSTALGACVEYKNILKTANASWRKRKITLYRETNVREYISENWFFSINLFNIFRHPACTTCGRGSFSPDVRVFSGSCTILVYVLLLSFILFHFYDISLRSRRRLPSRLVIVPLCAGRSSPPPRRRRRRRTCVTHSSGSRGGDTIKNNVKKSRLLQSSPLFPLDLSVSPDGKRKNRFRFRHEDNPPCERRVARNSLKKLMEQRIATLHRRSVSEPQDARASRRP